MTETKKPRFQHIAVNGKNAQTGNKYAKELTNAMNRLIDDGCSVQLNECKNFTVVMGIRPEEAPEAGAAEHPFARIMRLRAEQAHGHGAVELTPRTRELLDRFEKLNLFGKDIAAFVLEVKKNAAELARGFHAEEFSIAVKELEAARASHGDECAESKALKAITEALRGVVHTQLA